MTLAVVTIVHGRHDHLLRQQQLLAADVQPHQRIVVAMDDPSIQNVLRDGPTHTLIELASDAGAGALPLSRARNVGVAAAVAGGADMVVLLDVDCLPGRELLTRYSVAVQTHWTALCCGPVTYLPPVELPTPSDAAGVERLRELLHEHHRPHPARPAPTPGDLVRIEATQPDRLTDYALFWSLSFACSVPTWQRIGGFDEGYRGYGGEDTDFAMRAKTVGAPLVWVGGADAWHQHHPVSNPPVEHLADILRNGRRFERRWGFWPMSGWLAQFEKLNLIRRIGNDWQQIGPRQP